MTSQIRNCMRALILCGCFALAVACRSTSPFDHFIAYPLPAPSLAATAVVRSGYELSVRSLLTSDDVTDALGPRASRLTRGAIVVQIRVLALDPGVRFSLGWVRLMLGDRELTPLPPEDVVAIASLPTDLDPIRPSTPPPPDPDEKDPQPISDPLEAWLARTRSLPYRAEAQAEILRKTTLPSEIPIGDPLDFVVVFVPGAEGAAMPASAGASLILEPWVSGRAVRHEVPVPLS